MRHALSSSGRRLLAGQPGVVLPAGACASNWSRLRAVAGGRCGGGQSGWQDEAGTPFAVAHAAEQRVHRQHQRLDAGGLGAPDQLAQPAALAKRMELEPARPRSPSVR